MIHITVNHNLRNSVKIVQLAVNPRATYLKIQFETHNNLILKNYIESHSV